MVDFSYLENYLMFIYFLIFLIYFVYFIVLEWQVLLPAAHK